LWLASAMATKVREVCERTTPLATSEPPALVAAATATGVVASYTVRLERRLL
jgi:hypothetical protein